MASATKFNNDNNIIIVDYSSGGKEQKTFVPNYNIIILSQLTLVYCK